MVGVWYLERSGLRVFSFLVSLRGVSSGVLVGLCGELWTGGCWSVLWEEVMPFDGGGTMCVVLVGLGRWLSG